MTTRCESLQLATLYQEAFNVPAPEALGERRLRARQPAFIIWRGQPANGDVATPDTPDTPDTPLTPDTLEKPTAPRQLVAAQWGMVPHWVKSESDGRLRAPKLTLARVDTVTTSRNFRDPWLNGQRCIVPMMAFYADDWRTGKAVPTRIARPDGRPLGAAALWDRWVGPEGQVQLSFALLTLNANAHALMNRYGPPGNDVHMPVLLNEGAYDAWLDARVEKAKEFMRPYPAQSLTANPLEDKASKVPPGLR